MHPTSRCLVGRTRSPRERCLYGSWKIRVLILLVLSSSFWGEPCLAGNLEPKLNIHAYLTQAYGRTDERPLLGLDDDGTSDYRNAAINFRMNISERDDLVVQISHEAVGTSRAQEGRDEVELDWAYYSHRFGNTTRLRAGRLPIPFGIYNEVRDAGTVLEFYRPPVSIYYEVAFASETVDGAAVDHTFFAGRPWSLDGDAYYGSWDRPELVVGQGTVVDGDARDGHGARLWVNTPVSGLRFGFSAQRFDQTGGLESFRTGDRERFDIYLASLDADFSRFLFRGEAQLLKTSFATSDLEIESIYLLAGYRFNDHLAIYTLFENSTSFLYTSGPTMTTPFFDDWAIALVYQFTPNVLLRLETHNSVTGLLDEASSDPEPEVSYSILSLSASF